MKWHSKFFFFFCFLSFTGTLGAFPISIYVSPLGSDRNDGSKERPFASLSKAKETVKALKTAGNKSAVTIFLRKGTYFLEKTLIFSPEESGTEQAPYYIAAYQQEQVTLSGGVPLKTSWQRQQGPIWETSVPAGSSFQLLYANGKPLTCARYPNYDATILPYNGYAADALSKERVAGWKNPKGGFIHAMHSGLWGDMQYRITGKQGADSLLYEGGWQNNRPSAMHRRFRFVENIFEELDSPDEWYLDSARHKLYVYPPAGVDPHTLSLEGAVLESLIEFRGSEKQPVHDIFLKGLHFTHTAPTFMKTREPLMRSDWAIYRGGAVLLEGTERCSISQSTFDQLGGNAIFVSGYNRQARISGNLIEQIGASAICFVGNPSAVCSPSYRYEEFVPAAQMDTAAGPQNNDYPADCLAEDNLIRHIGTIEKQVAGVEIQLASSVTVRHNSIYDVPRAGINIGDGAWGGHLIEGNDVFLTVLETSDHGAFNSWGRDRYWHPDRAVMDSLVAVHPGWVLLDAVKTTTIRHNRFRCDHGWDIDLDDGSSNYAIYDNLCLSGGLKLREGFYRRVTNNILVNNGFHPHVWFRDSHDVFTHNIVMSSHQPIRINHWGDTVDANFFTNQTDLQQARSVGVEAHGASGDVLFINAPKGDFRVKDSSPALTLGFHNFAMDNFGVQSARLKQLTAQPEIPVLMLQNTGGKKSGVSKWHGATVKDMETLGEQSAAGVADIKGVLLLEVPQNSAAGQAGLKAGDVILKSGSSDIPDVLSLRKAEAASRRTGRLPLQVWRNQRMNMLELKLP